MNTKRQQSPQAETPSKKARGAFNPRDEAAAPVRNPPFKTRTSLPSKPDEPYSDQESEDRDRAYIESEKEKEKMKENDIEFQLALDEDNIQEALAMATTDEQRERARKAAEYIEQVGRKYSYLFEVKSSVRKYSLALQVKSRRNCLTDPRKRIMPSFKATDEAVKREVSEKRLRKKYRTKPKTVNFSYKKNIKKCMPKLKMYPNTYLFCPQMQQARDIIADKNNNDQAEKLKLAAAAGAAESLRQARTSGFATPSNKSTPKTSQPSFKPNLVMPELNLRPQGPQQAVPPVPTSGIPLPPKMDLRPQPPASQATPAAPQAQPDNSSPVNLSQAESGQPTSSAEGNKSEEASKENPGNRTTADISLSDDEEITEEVLLPLGLKDKPTLTVVQEVIQAHNRIHGSDESKSVEVLHHHVGEHEGRVPDLGPAAKMTIGSLMPAGEEGETGPIDQTMVANLATRGNCIELVLVQIVIHYGIRYLALPTQAVFDEVTGSCNAALIEENTNWCNVLEGAETSRTGVGIITLNYGSLKAAERFRALIVSCSTATVRFATYPVTNVMRRYAITAFLHQGLKHIPSKLIAQVFKGCNPDLKGSFTIVDCQTIVEGDRAGARIVSFDPSPEFMAYLATTPKSHKFRMAHKRIYINGGIRADSVAAKKNPLLTPEAASAFLNGAKDTIMRSSMRQHGTDPRQYRYLLTLNEYPQIKHFFRLLIAGRPDSKVDNPQKHQQNRQLKLPFLSTDVKTRVRSRSEGVHRLEKTKLKGKRRRRKKERAEKEDIKLKSQHEAITCLSKNSIIINSYQASRKSTFEKCKGINSIQFVCKHFKPKTVIIPRFDPFKCTKFKQKVLPRTLRRRKNIAKEDINQKYKPVLMIKLYKIMLASQRRSKINCKKIFKFYLSVSIFTLVNICAANLYNIAAPVEYTSSNPLRHVQQIAGTRVSQINNEQEKVYIYFLSGSYPNRSYFITGQVHFESSSCSTPVALGTLVSLDILSGPGHCQHNQTSHLACSSQNRVARPLVKTKEIRGEKRNSNANEPQRKAVGSNWPEYNGKTSSRNSSKLTVVVRSKSTLKSKQAARQQGKTKQPHSCKQKEEEKRRRYASKSGKLQQRQGQEKLYIKDARKNRRQRKRNYKK